jgi:hypothetical protein
MTIALLIALLASFGALLATIRHHEFRIDQLLAHHAAERATPSPDTAALIALVQNMAQRIQAPEQAVTDHSIQTELPSMPQPALPDDDDGFWAGREDMTKDELAEHLMAAENAIG